MPDSTTAESHTPPDEATCSERWASLGVAHACSWISHEGDVHRCVCGGVWNAGKAGCRAVPAEPVTAEGLRDRIAKALIARIKASVLIDPVKQPGTVGQPLAATEYDLANAVLAVLAGDPGDLPARMAEALRSAFEYEVVDDWGQAAREMFASLAAGDPQSSTLLAAAMGVRDEQMASLAARLEHALAELSNLRDHRARWETEKARADKAEAAVSNIQHITEQVMKSLDDHPHYDYVAIVEEIGEKYGFDIASIDDIPSEEYWAIVDSHDTTSAR